ncbi:MAG: tetratricopeptide repeat protein [Candidatus Marinimicrobia bacterium]|nr:tetratricopeptide repeat protein [Candidatus Neomarinimicrobiota bacterium]MCF7839728.1 tetratricopeptide repeat protein [Candidatus Neomarinimicrobiota bacterium]MCF7903227.1 tetratricopeptide repeat protein [Candidatus Neomarinimicrobiota bacterium]
MLQPRKKITKKEMRRDPLLESYEKSRRYYEANKRNINAGIVIFLALIILGWGWQNNRKQMRNEAELSATKAIAAYMSGSTMGVEEELQSVYEQYQGKDGTDLSVYYLGVMKLDSNKYDAARMMFKSLTKNSKSKIIKSAALLKLAYIKENQNDYAGAANLYEEAARVGKFTARNEALIAAGYNYYRAGNMDAARGVVASVESEKLTSELLDSYRYLQGMIGS